MNPGPPEYEARMLTTQFGMDMRCFYCEVRTEMLNFISMIFPTLFDTIQKSTKVLLDASKEVGLEVNPEKTKYMLVSRCQKAGQR
jgi:hypothetical protein